MLRQRIIRAAATAVALTGLLGGIAFGTSSADAADMPRQLIRECHAAGWQIMYSPVGEEWMLLDGHYVPVVLRKAQHVHAIECRWH